MPAYRLGNRLLLQNSLEPKCASFVYPRCFPVAAIQRHSARSLHDVDREPESELESNLWLLAVETWTCYLISLSLTFYAFKSHSQIVVWKERNRRGKQAGSHWVVREK